MGNVTVQTADTFIDVLTVTRQTMILTVVGEEDPLEETTEIITPTTIMEVKATITRRNRRIKIKEFANYHDFL